MNIEETGTTTFDEVIGDMIYSKSIFGGWGITEKVLRVCGGAWRGDAQYILSQFSLLAPHSHLCTSTYVMNYPLKRLLEPQEVDYQPPCREMNPRSNLSVKLQS